KEVLLQIAGHCKRIFGLALLRRLVTFPFDKAAAHRVVLEFVKCLVTREQFRCHRVWMWKVSLRGIEDDVFQRQIETRRTNRHLVRFVRIGCQPVEELGRASGWRLTQQTRERRPVSAMALSRGTETTKEMDLKSCGPFELILWQLSHALEEIICDSHRTHGVRTRWPGTHLI